MFLIESENSTNSRRIINNEELSYKNESNLYKTEIPLSQADLLHEGFPNETQIFDEIERVYATVTFIDGIVFFGKQMAHYAKRLYHKIHGIDDATTEAPKNKIH